MGEAVMDYIKGADRHQTIMLPDCVDDYVDANNPVRVIDAYVNSLDMSALGFTRSQLNNTGRPPYCSKDLLKLYLYGYMNRIRSSRRLEAESKRNLEVIWLLGTLSPDHKTIARFRQENPEALKNVFRDFVRLCVRLGLYGKELLAIDGSKFKACNSKDRAFTEKKLADRIARLDSKIEEYVQKLEELDFEENRIEANKASEEIEQIIVGLVERKSDYEGYMQKIRESGETQITLTDPDSRLMVANGKADVCYNIQTAVDSKNKMIVEFDVSNNSQDKNQMGPMSEKAADVLGTQQFSVVADAGYDSASDIAHCLLNGVIPHVAGTIINICIPTDAAESESPKSQKNGRCVYLKDRNIAICPMGNFLYPSSYHKSNSAATFYSKVCSTCSCKCTASRYKRFEMAMPQSEFSKDYDDKGLSVKQIGIIADKNIVSQRQSIVEHPFGTIKRTMDAGYMLTRGKQAVIGELALTFLAYNLKRAINILGTKQLESAISMC